MLKAITEFQGPYRFLSNFWPAKFEWNGLLWHSSEAAYVAAKTNDRELQEALSEIIDPGSVKRFGRGLGPLRVVKVVNTRTGEEVVKWLTMSIRPDWDDVKLQFMNEIVRAKFEQNSDLLQKLLDTEDAILEEGNNWKDRYWGICPPASGNGRNELGKILMKIREEHKNA